MSLKMMKYVGTWVLAVGALLILATPAQASLLRIGENDGGSIVFDGESEVRTMNILLGQLTPLTLAPGFDLLVQMTIAGDSDNAVNFNLVRLILSLDSAVAASFAGPLVSLETARTANPALKEFEVPTDPSSGEPLVDINALVVPFFADFALIPGSSTLYALAPGDQSVLNQLLLANPNVTFHAGIGVREVGDSLSSCDAEGDNCGNATATFELTSAAAPTPPTASVPEPTTLLLLGIGLVSARFSKLRARGRADQRP